MIKGSMECVLPVSYLLSQLRCVFVPARVPMLALNVNILTLPHVVTLPLTSHDLWPRRKHERLDCSARLIILFRYISIMSLSIVLIFES